MKVRLHAALILAMAVAAAALVAAGCGGSSKPDYCSNVSDLQQSVNDLKGVQLQSGALSTIQTDVQKVQSNATAVVSSAKQDFPSQTSALQSSVSTLSATINALPHPRRRSSWCRSRRRSGASGPLLRTSRTPPTRPATEPPKHGPGVRTRLLKTLRSIPRVATSDSGGACNQVDQAEVGKK